MADEVQNQGVVIPVRPLQALVDEAGRGVADIGVALGNEGAFVVQIPELVGNGSWLISRMVSALPLQQGPPRPQVAAVLTVDPLGRVLGDPTDGSTVGEPPLYIARLLNATRTANTRGF